MLCQSVRRDVHISDIDGGNYDHLPSPVWVAAGLGHDRVIEEFARFGLLKASDRVGDHDLLNRSVESECEERVFLSPLGNAAREGNATTVVLLLRLGADIQKQGYDRLGPGEESLANAWRTCATLEERMRVEAKGKAKADAKAAIAAAERQRREAAAAVARAAEEARAAASGETDPALLPGAFKCSVCSKAFKREMNLIFHMTTHRTSMDTGFFNGTAIEPTEEFLAYKTYFASLPQTAAPADRGPNIDKLKANIDIEPGGDGFNGLPRTVARRAGHVVLADYLDAVYAAGCYSSPWRKPTKSLHFKCFLAGPRLSLALLRSLVRSGRATMRTSTMLRSSRQSRLMWLFKDLPDDLFVCIVRQWWTGQQLF